MNKVRKKDHCYRCKKKFRPRGTLTKQYPGTVLHAGHGRCPSCRNIEHREKAGGALEPRKPKPRAKTQATSLLKFKEGTPKRYHSHAVELPPYECGEDRNLTWIRDYVTDRRRRGIPVQGLAPETLDVLRS